MSQHTIVFVRHAKAEAGEAGSDDTRALTGPGRDQAKTLGRDLREYIEAVDTVFVSPAMRASQTWEAMAEGAGIDPKAPHVRTDEVLYTGNAQQIWEAVRLESDGYTSIVVGHEPTLSAAVELVVKEGEADAISAGMPTASAAVVTWGRNWKEWHSHVADFKELVKARR